MYGAQSLTWEISGHGTGVIKTLYRDGNKVLQRGITVLQIEI